MDGPINVAHDIKGEHSKTLELYENTFLILQFKSSGYKTVDWERKFQNTLMFLSPGCYRKFKWTTYAPNSVVGIERNYQIDGI